MKSDEPHRSTSDCLERVKQYHEQTKHDFNQYARSLGYMDWANQPDPFRRFEGAPLIPLPHLTPGDNPVSPPYENLYQPGSIPSEPLTIESLSRFFEYALSITAWKEFGGNRWALRSNPSSGNLHPTEGYLFLGHHSNLPLTPGLYHYAPKEHGLEHRCACSEIEAQQLLDGFPAQSFLVGLSSIHWREAWKYGERAFRYCQHDVGHAIGTLRIAAATLGWHMVVLEGTSDDVLSTFLGLDRSDDFVQSEKEFPELVAVVWPRQAAQSQQEISLALDEQAVRNLTQSNWQGKANRLSRDNPIPWEIIDDVAEASWKSAHDLRTNSLSPPPVSGKGKSESDQLSSGHIIHQRRSAVSFDGHTSISAQRFYTMLSRVMPHSELSVNQRPMPWDSIPWKPTIHLALFVHRVDGIPPGLYLLIRDRSQEQFDEFKSVMHEQFVWTKPESCPEDLPLYVLEDGNAQKIATQVSCWQEIAGDSAFSLGMISEFDHTLETDGPWAYRRLFWETGLIGQVLYLEAEAAGVRATGIGCFFDDRVHRVFGFFPDTKFQSLYHFTVGGPVDDNRLTTLPPYGDHVS
ncbi:MAG: SagB/ThcOx family dehydrogenase [Nitrospirales bacterium]